MNTIPKDVLEFLKEKSSIAFSTYVVNELKKLDVGGYFIQYCRSIVYNSIGDIKRFKRIREIDDPRDVISLGDEEDGMFHWYSIPLSKISEFEREKVWYITKRLQEDIPIEIYNDNSGESIGETINKLKNIDDEGFSVEELRRVFGRKYSELPSAYLEFLKQMGKRNNVFVGIDHSPFELRSYKESAYASQYFEPIWDEVRKELNNYFIFLSSQGCSWFMFKKDPRDNNPEIFLLTESSLDVKSIYPTFIDMLRTLTKK
ncbi:SMI1/KNR4 family protein [Neolewinella lacunae]|uniref:Knr4/Smi1-like domain-containing protein n=1 Tax=Neolewinella lacunae TaxID=1517758 RepID=A0A923T893_9BACT|nr:SMI1/KNR4 family protein [Neolewinella lacunae]MBC6995365.1 hypothetical protein [Neolewinella lacunae]MDN3633077.1 SMI1/KNR4 family protein [Neolewinella lacunae]